MRRTEDIRQFRKGSAAKYYDISIAAYLLYGSKRKKDPFPSLRCKLFYSKNQDTISLGLSIQRRPVKK